MKEALPSPSGFSLAETVIALGIVTFALVGILGLFPVALQSSSASQTETRGTLVARTVLGDLQGPSPGDAFLATGPDVTSDRQSINLAASQTQYAVYSGTGQALALGDAALFSGGTGLPDAAFLLRLTIQANDPSPGLSRVVLNLVSPPGLPNGPARTTNTFVTILRNR